MNLLSLARFLLNWNIIVQVFYFLGELIISNSCLNSVEALWLIDAVTLLGALLLNSVLFHIFFTHPKMEGIFFIHILWRTVAVRREYRRIPNWYIIRMHFNDIKSLSSKGSAPIKSAAPILFSKMNFGKRN